MAILIRAFNPADARFVLSLAQRFSEFDLPEWRSLDEIDNTSRNRLRKAVEQSQSGSAIFIAEEESGGSVGFIHLETETDYFTGKKQGRIADLAVAKPYEARGIGFRLLETAEDWARGQGYDLLSLIVFEGNTRARELYDRYGFGPEVLKYVKPVRPRKNTVTSGSRGRLRK
jgi:ribosomal protein S18 acetylase RimI-like enzyme